MTRPESTPAAPHYVMSMVIIGVLFFIFGFVTWLNGPLTIFVKLAFHLDNVTAFLIPVAFYMSYFVLALPSAAVLKRTGMKRGMALGLFVMAIGAALFGQFIVLHSYHGALAALFVIGAGLSILQTASNPYVSILGPIESGARRVAIMGICNKGAGALAPLVFGWLVLSGIGSFEQQVKAAFLYKFLSYVEWPAGAIGAASTPIVIGVLDADDIADELRTVVAKRRIGQHPLEVRRADESNALDGVNALFVGAGGADALSRLAPKAHEKSVLLVSDFASGLAAGSVINLVVVDNRVRFEVSLEAAERSDLKLSSRMLAVAMWVHPTR